MEPLRPLTGHHLAETVTLKNFEKVFEVFIDSFSGATGGFCASLILHPIENLRIRLQTM